jgi:NADH-quinone oxidoreductase subunit H
MNLHAFSTMIAEFLLGIGSWFFDLVGLEGFGDWLLATQQVNGLAIVFDILIVFLIALVNVLVMLWIERKVMGRLMDRRATMLIPPISHKIWGKRYPKGTITTGFWQNPADGIKFFMKEHIVPKDADKFGFELAPIVIIASSVLLLVSLPLSSEFFVVDLDAGLIFVFAIFAIAPFAILVAGWAQNNKYTLIGGMRSAAQMMSYEIPLVLSFIGVIMIAGSFNIAEIVEFQQNNTWFIIPQFIGFMVFMIAIVAEVERIPFDLPEAEAELVEGWTTEYGGGRWVIMMMGSYIRGFAGCAMATYLFLGGWAGPSMPFVLGGFNIGILPPELWFLIKVYILFFGLVWIRAALPRIRTDQILEIGWKRLLPLSLLNIFIAVVFIEGGWLIWLPVFLIILAIFIVHMIRRGKEVAVSG